MNTVTRQAITDALCKYFSETVELSQVDDSSWSVIVPSMDTHNDLLEIVLNVDGERVFVSDAGFLHREVALTTAQEDPEASVWQEIQATANRLDLSWGGGQLWKEVESVERVGHGIARLVNGLQLALQGSGPRVPKVQVHFWEEVEMFLADSDIKYKRNQRWEGVSRVRHRVDFTLGNGRPHVVQAIASEPSMRRALNIFYDLLEAEQDIVPVSFVDEEKSGYSLETFEQLSYKSEVYQWKDRQRFVNYWRRM